MHPHGNGTLDVDAALGDVARIYRSITGRDLPRNGTPVAPIPPEHDARAVAQNALEQLANQLRLHAPHVAANHLVVPAVPAATAAVDCWENGSWLHFYVDLPAVRPEAVQLMLEHGTLLVRAHREREMPEAARPAALERPAGLVERRILLPPGIDSGQIHAQLRDGVLHVRLRRVEQPAEGQRIPVR